MAFAHWFIEVCDAAGAILQVYEKTDVHAITWDYNTGFGAKAEALLSELITVLLSQEVK